MEELQRNGRRIAGIVTLEKRSARPFADGPETVKFVTDSPITPTSSDTDILVTRSGSIPVNVYLVEHGTRATAFVRPNSGQGMAGQ